MRKIIKEALLTLGLVTATVSGMAAASVQGESFDVLASVMEEHNKELSASAALESSKDEARRYHEAIIAGWWEFMQAKSNAKPGEYCAASFLRAKPLKEKGKPDSPKAGVVVTLFGPGGSYRGALLAFSPLGDESTSGFPKLPSGSPVLVTLTQGNTKPVTLNAIYMKTRPKAPPLLAFAVPSIEALMQGMEDTWAFDVTYQGSSIANIEWHDGLRARTELKKCLSGIPFESKLQGGR